MRTIRFRGRCAFSGTWRYGFYYVSKGNHIIRGEKDRESIVLEKTVGQFTGLHDKNGKEIYEGDFITYSGITSNGQKIIRVVNYNSDYARFQGGMYPLSETKNLIEVIGNIYENPELLTD